jgi:hypothetical protein
VPALDEIFGAVVFRPFIDLGPALAGGPVSAWGVEFACRSLAEDRPYPWTYGEYAASFRNRLLEVAGLDFTGRTTHVSSTPSCGPTGGNSCATTSMPTPGYRPAASGGCFGSCGSGATARDAAGSAVEPGR